MKRELAINFLFSFVGGAMVWALSPFLSGQVEGLLNTRKLTLERQLFLDDFDSLSAEAQRQVTDLVAGLKASGVITPTQIDAK
jgi:hypothetical protein